MKEYLKKLPKKVQELIGCVSDAARQMDISVYLVGGFVRDLMLGEPNLDLDIVAEGDGIALATQLADRLNAHLVRHRRFGTATVVTPDRIKIDITTAREEYYEKPAVLPCVKAGALKDDLKRRDFSINAMAISINRRNFGELIDFFKGRDDLRYKRIRILHDLSFIDDPTRILRGVRFEQRYGFHIEPHTLRVLKCAVEAGMLLKLSPHRVRDDIILILKELNPLPCIRRMQHITGFAFIHPRLGIDRNVLGLLSAVHREIAWFNNNFSRRRKLDTWLMYFTVMLDSLSPRQITALCRRFALNKGDEKRMLSFRKESLALKNRLSKPGLKPSDIFKLLEPLSYEVVLLTKAHYGSRRLNNYISRFLRLYNGMANLISGKDLMRMGLTPGPRYKEILDELLYLRLDGRLRTRAQQIRWIKDKIKR
jgi:tRNA nucleotidyltransferase (CCA-adding enzyme)